MLQIKTDNDRARERLLLDRRAEPCRKIVIERLKNVGPFWSALSKTVPHQESGIIARMVVDRQKVEKLITMQ